MSKLLEHGVAQDPVYKAVSRAEARMLKDHRAAVRVVVKELRELVANHVSDARTAGNPDGAKRLKILGDNMIARLKRMTEGSET